MIFIWYGNVYTYASQLINYSYCLVFFCLSVIYIMYSLPSTDTSFEMGKKEVKKEEKEGSVGISHFDYKRVNEGKTSLYWRVTGNVKHSDRGREWGPFFPPHLSFMSLSLQNRKKETLWTIRSTTHTHALTPYLPWTVPPTINCHFYSASDSLRNHPDRQCTATMLLQCRKWRNSKLMPLSPVSLFFQHFNIKNLYCMVINLFWQWLIFA